MKRFLRHGTYTVVTFLLAGAVFPALPQTSPLRLTLQEAIDRGVRNNLRALLAGTNLNEARATSQRARALLLPKVRGESSATIQNRSLRAFGITGPGIPKVVGPFSLYDFRVSVDQPLFDLSAYYLWKASGRQEEAARLSLDDAREWIVRLVSGLYLGVQAAEARSEAARWRVTTAEALVKLARDRRDEGVATGVDVLRAEVSLANDRQRLLEADNTTRRSLLELARTIGVGLGTRIELAEPLTFVEMPAPAIEEALPQALGRRADYLALRVRRDAVLGERKSVEARKLPRLDLRADYGGIGRNLGELDATGTIRGSLSISLFNRDRGGEIAQIDTRIQRINHTLADLHVAIEQEIREALLNLESAAAQVEVARQGRALAERELELARTRFETGVANNIEVTNAQESVARAQENSILALTRYADGRAALRRALGNPGQQESPLERQEP